MVATGDPEHLSFSDDLRRLDSLNDCPRLPLFAASASSADAAGTDLTFGLQLANGRRIAAQSISGQHGWGPVVRIRKRLAEMAV
jgi:hypothetical protein